MLLSDVAMQAHMEGAAFLTKADTMARASSGGLASKPGAIYGVLTCRSPSKPAESQALHGPTHHSCSLDRV